MALPTFRAFMRDAAGRYVALDGRLWRTLVALLAKPGFLTLEYFAGRRRRYIRPARLFLVLYLLLFAFIGFVQSPGDLSDQVVLVNIDDSESQGAGEKPADRPTSGTRKPVAPGNRNSVAPASTSAPVSARSPVTAPAPESARRSARPDTAETYLGLDDELNFTMRFGGSDVAMPEFLQRRLDHFRKLDRAEKAERLYSGMLRFGTYAMILLLPVFALLLMVAYLGGAKDYPRRPRLYAEHLVYSAHLHSFAAFIVMLIIVAPWPPVRAALAVWVFVYFFKARTAVYGGTWWAGLLRAAVVATIYFVLVSMAMFGLLAISAFVR